MKNIKCVIRKNLKTNDNEHLIYLRYIYNRKYILFRTDIYVNFKNWNIKSGRVRKSNNYELKNMILIEKEIELEKLILELISNKTEPTLLSIKIEYFKQKNQFQDDKTKPLKINEKTFLIDFESFIDYKKDLDTISAPTIKTYRTTLNKLSSFQKDTNYILHYNTIDNEFYYKFLKYLRKDTKKKKGLLDNSVDKHIKNLKLFMNYSLSIEKHNNNLYRTFKRTRSKTDFVALDIDELRKLYYKYEPKDETLKEIRDAFIFGCSTGLRYSDLTTLTSGNFIIKRDDNNRIIQDSNSSFINISNSKKTKEHLTIPLNNFICKMIDDYDIEKSNQITFLNHSLKEFNEKIKIICRDAGIVNNVSISKTKNQELVITDKPKYSYCSSHTMRRTFISILAVMTEITNIQAVSGHKDIKVLADYIKRNDAQLNTISGCFNGNIFNGIDLGEEEKEQVIKVQKVKSRFSLGVRLQTNLNFFSLILR